MHTCIHTFSHSFYVLKLPGRSKIVPPAFIAWLDIRMGDLEISRLVITNNGKYSGYLNTKLVRYSNGLKELGCQMVWYSNAVWIPDTDNPTNWIPDKWMPSCFLMNLSGIQEEITVLKCECESRRNIIIIIIFNVGPPKEDIFLSLDD